MCSMLSKASLSVLYNYESMWLFETNPIDLNQLHYLIDNWYNSNTTRICVKHKFRLVREFAINKISKCQSF